MPRAQRTLVDWQPLPPYQPGLGPLAGARIPYEWMDASGGFLTVDIGGRQPAFLGGGSEAYPATVRYRVQAARPSSADRGDPLQIISQLTRRIDMLEGERLWLRADVSATEAIIILS